LRNLGSSTDSTLPKKIDSLAGKPRRRRRKPEVAESEILEAAENFLSHHPFRELTIDDVMSRTGLSRPSFYEYFRDRHHLIMKLTERLTHSTSTRSESWLSGSDMLEDLRVTLEGVVELYVTRGHLLRALADAACHDPQAEVSYRKMMATFIDVTATRIREGIERGVIKGLDAEQVATALVFMNEGYLIEKLGTNPQTDPKVVAETLLLIWQRVLYPA
jgi:TetR/AcrR family transcriptional regulator, ethionamide resistance regulator